MSKRESAFHPELYKKVLLFEWALIIFGCVMQSIALLAPPDPTAPNLGVSIILLLVVGAISLLAPVRGGYWDRVCYLLLELMLMTGATAAGLQRFLFPLFVVVIAKSCILLDKPGFFLISFVALVSQMAYAMFKISWAYPVILKHGCTPVSIFTLFAASLVFLYVAIVLMVLVAIVTQALMAEQKSRLEAERLSEEVQSLATELERTRIAREIHDSLGHTLTSLNIQLDIARKFQLREPERSSEALETAKELASQSLTDVRMAVQSIRNASDFDFSEAVSVLINDVRQSNMQVDLKMNVQQIPSPVGFQLFRVLQECLTNVLKHANASQVQIKLDQKDDNLELSVSDNGKGLSTPETTSGGFGIKGMQERIQSMHGTVEISAEPNCGTSIQVQIPLKAVQG